MRFNGPKAWNSISENIFYFKLQEISKKRSCQRLLVMLLVFLLERLSMTFTQTANGKYFL